MNPLRHFIKRDKYGKNYMSKAGEIEEYTPEEPGISDKMNYLVRRGHSKRGVSYMDDPEINTWYNYYHDNPEEKSQHEKMLERHERMRRYR